MHPLARTVLATVAAGLLGAIGTGIWISEIDRAVVRAELAAAAAAREELRRFIADTATELREARREAMARAEAGGKLRARLDRLEHGFDYIIDTLQFRPGITGETAALASRPGPPRPRPSRPGQVPAEDQRGHQRQ